MMNTMTILIRRSIQGKLSDYCNNSLNPIQRRFVDLWLAYDPAARQHLEGLQKLSAAVRDQAEQQPDPQVLQLIQAQIVSQYSSEPLLDRRRKWAVGLVAITALAVAIVLVWQILPPGITLQWSVGSGQPETFRIYRAAGTEAEANTGRDFQLIRELQADAEAPEYSYLDIQSLPGQSYVYRVDVIDASGDVADSRTVTGSGLAALPGQLTILLVTIIGGLSVWSLSISGRFQPGNARMNQFI
jgi:hypothetical protein